ncbi:MAG TPA: thiamine phosphate synthase [Fibrobacter sp.]|nr:thiamine phosphate synthase [Fibrobacter sp.]
MKIDPIQVLTWDKAPIPHLGQVKALLQAGARWIQLRQKNADDKEKLKTALAVSALCREYQATLIINDDPHLCLKCNAHGVHLGLSDTSISEARHILGSKAIIGGTANTLEQVEKRMEEGADYIGLGPFRFTSTKENLSRALGLGGVSAVTSFVQKRAEKGLYTCPFVVIGGINPADLKSLKTAGANGVAVCSAIVSAHDISKAFSSFKW